MVTVIIVVLAIRCLDIIYYTIYINHRDYNPVKASYVSERAVENRLRGMAVDYVLWVGKTPGIDLLQTLKSIVEHRKGDVIFVESK